MSIMVFNSYSKMLIIFKEETANNKQKKKKIKLKNSKCNSLKIKRKIYIFNINPPKNYCFINFKTRDFSLS